MVQKIFNKQLFRGLIVLPILSSVLFLPLMGAWTLLLDQSQRDILLGLVMLLLSVLLIALMTFYWWRLFQKERAQQSLFDFCLPLVVALAFYLLSFFVAFWLNGNSYDGVPITVAQYIGGLFLLAQLNASLAGDFQSLPLIYLGTFLPFILLSVFWYWRYHKGSVAKTKNLWLVAGLALLLGLTFWQGTQHRPGYVSHGWNDPNQVSAEVHLQDYAPFTNSPKLANIEGQASLAIEKDYPVLDGATALYPVYAAMVQEIYKGLDEDSVLDYVFCNKTAVAYENLIAGQVDLIFTLQPSDEQKRDATQAGKQLKLTPIGHEAFVFFVNKDNDVHNLTLAQIQDIYQKKVTNWNQVGGGNREILPFQRPKNSGSQTAMENEVMNGKKLAKPVMEEVAEGMGGIIDQVADYRNYEGALGYSFRFYSQEMNQNDDIRLLNINGIAPTVENIQNGKYPFTVDIYAVTTGNEKVNTKKIIDWLLSDEGQNLIDKSGYVPLSK